jgi:hypothetical protein
MTIEARRSSMPTNALTSRMRKTFTAGLDEDDYAHLSG